MPLAQYHFDMSATEFRDGLALRYHRPFLKAHASCDGCGGLFSLDHALNFKKGGLVIQRHNEIRDSVGDLASLVWNQVLREPVVRDADDANAIPALVADLSIRGVWQPQAVALLDIRVINTDAQSYLATPVQSVLAGAEEGKKKKYRQACEDRHAAFTPFVTSVDGAFGREANFFVRCLAERLALKWNRGVSEVTNWTRTRLSFSIIRATCQCIRGTRRKWRGLGVEDGAPIRLAMD